MRFHLRKSPFSSRPPPPAHFLFENRPMSAFQRRIDRHERETAHFLFENRPMSDFQIGNGKVNKFCPGTGICMLRAGRPGPLRSGHRPWPGTFHPAHPHTLTDIRLTLLTQIVIFWEKSKGRFVQRCLKFGNVFKNVLQKINYPFQLC